VPPYSSNCFEIIDIQGASSQARWSFEKGLFRGSRVWVIQLIRVACDRCAGQGCWIEVKLADDSQVCLRESIVCVDVRKSGPCYRRAAVPGNTWTCQQLPSLRLQGDTIVHQQVTAIAMAQA
jgi:hypothetical protein